jgi:hypothetical protein
MPGRHSNSRPSKRPAQDAKATAANLESQMFQFLIVKFDQTPDRTVLANGQPVGVTNHMLLLSAGVYEITLSGAGFTPTEQTITLTNTTAQRPTIAVFT